MEPFFFDIPNFNKSLVELYKNGLSYGKRKTKQLFDYLCFTCKPVVGLVKKSGVRS